MSIPKYGDVGDLPLIADAVLHERVGALLGRAIRRQLWVIFLDDQHCQLPVLLPIDGMPQVPALGEESAFGSFLADLGEEMGAASVVLVFERAGRQHFSARDLSWARFASLGARLASVSVRAMFLCHTDGVRWITPDDYG